MFNFILKKYKKARITQDQRGFTLIEAVIGTALLVIVGVAVLAGISTSFKASSTTDKISTGLALAQSQIESLQALQYNSTVVDAYGNALYPKIGSIPTGYSISSMRWDGVSEVGYAGDEIDPPVVAAVFIDNLGAPTTTDGGIQRITITVYRAGDDNPVTLTAYKINPSKDK